jgi:pentatricopeptide repeat protein
MSLNLFKLQEWTSRSGCVTKENISRVFGAESTQQKPLRGVNGVAKMKRETSNKMVRSVAGGIQKEGSMVSMGRRGYVTRGKRGGNGKEAGLEYTEEDLLRGTIEANGFKVLGDDEVEVDIPKWEKIAQTAFDQMRWADAITAYENIKGVGPNAGPMTELYIRALDALGSRGDDIINVYNEARNRKIPILSHSYAKVMKALFNRGDKSKVIELFEQMRSERVPGTPELFAILLTLYYKENPADIETALGILTTMKGNGVKPNIDVIDRCLLFFVQAGRRDLIIDTYKQYIQDGSIKPRRITLSIMAETMLEEGEIEKANSFLKKLDELKQYPRLRTYELLIESCLHTRRNRKMAEEKFTEMVYNAKYKATLAVYKSFFRYFEDKGDYDGLQRMLERMVKDEVAPDAGILESMLKVYFRHRKDNEFMANFVNMLDRQMMPGREFWTMRLKILDEDEQFPDFVLLLKEYEYMLQAGIEPTEEELRLVAGSMHRSNRPDLFEKFAKTEMAPRGVQYSVQDYALLMRSYQMMMDKEKVTETYHRFVTSGLVDAEPHLFMFQSLIAWHSVEAAMKLFDEELKPAVESKKYVLNGTQLPRLLESFSFLGYPGVAPFMSAFEFFLGLHANGEKQHFNSDVFDIAIRFLAGTRYIDRAITLFHAMQSDYRIGPTRAIYHSLLEALASATERESTLKHHASFISIFSTYLADPAMMPFHQKIISTFLLYLIRHGSHYAFSHAIGWYRTLGETDVHHLSHIQATALRKWLQQQDTASFIPETYISRDLAHLQGAILPEKSELELRHYDIPL